LGKLGEAIAANWLKKQGWRIIEKNVRGKIGELDIVAKKPGRTLAFVEVKTMMVSDPATGLAPEDQMTAAKLRKFKRASELFGAKHPEHIVENRGWETDVVAISFFKDPGGEKRGDILTNYSKYCLVRFYENV